MYSMTMRAGLSAGALGLLALAVITGTASAADEQGHYCKQEMRMLESVLTAQHGFSLPGEGSGLPHTCGPNGCHQIPDWIDDACTEHEHVLIP